jgi:peptidoglycan/LPS O-acetylase OafA/YrhL
VPKQYSEHYRPDIDGLRALAVLPVLLFHAKLGCPGGFVGVDIFFVISGFLISSLILKDLTDGTFSLTAFWERRIRRILPALVTVVLATLVAGWFLFLPEDLIKLGKAAIAQSTLMSNFLFYQQWLDGNGYFAPTVYPKPLVHTWSLAVEEQFYLLFPLLLAFLARWQRPSLVIVTILIIAIGSLMLSVYGCIHYPAATFYLLPARAWELLLGALLALLRGRVVINKLVKARIVEALPTLQLLHDRIDTNKLVREITGWLGLCLVCYPIFSYNSLNEFPGWAAVPPCLGAALIIFSSEAKLSIVGRILAWKPAVFIGLISYSLYLWHWPLLVFSKYPFGSQSWKVSASMLLVSAVLATLSWKFVEIPFRKRRVLKKRLQIFWFAGISMTALLALGFFVVQGQGLPLRYSGRALSYLNSRNHFAFRNSISLDQAVTGQFPELGLAGTNQPIRLLIWGDSHAMSVTPVLDELCRRYSWRGIQATHSQTAPVLEYKSMGAVALNEDSPAFAAAVLDYITKNHVQNVIITAYWKYYPASDEFKADLLSTVHAVIKSGAKVYILEDVPTQAPDLATKTAFATLHNTSLEQVGITPKQHRERDECCME